MTYSICKQLLIFFAAFFSICVIIIGIVKPFKSPSSSQEISANEDIYLESGGFRKIKLSLDPPKTHQAEIRASPWKEDDFMEIKLPKVTSNASEPVLCTAIRIPFDYAYVTAFSTLKSLGTVHHFLLYQCEEPGSGSINESDENQPVWNCESPSNMDPKYKFLKKCRDLKESLIFGWDHKPKNMFLPE